MHTKVTKQEERETVISLPQAVRAGIEYRQTLAHAVQIHILPLEISFMENKT